MGHVPLAQKQTSTKVQTPTTENASAKLPEGGKRQTNLRLWHRAKTSLLGIYQKYTNL